MQARYSIYDPSSPLWRCPLMEAFHHLPWALGHEGWQSPQHIVEKAVFPYLVSLK